VGAQGVALWRADRVLMVDGLAVRCGEGCDHAAGEAPVVVGGDVTATLIAGIEMLQLHPQHGGVQLVETAVGAVERVLVLVHLAVRSQVPN
jgi:hypothetical protein